MTVRRRKRGGHHFALTCDYDGCSADYRAPVNGISAYTLRDYAARTGWATAGGYTAPQLVVDGDLCPQHRPSETDQ